MKKLLLVISLILVFSLTGCMDHIEDSNGDDTALASFSIQAELDSGTISSRGSYSSASYSGGTTYATMYEEIDYDNISMSYNIFSGITKIQATEVNEGDSFNLSADFEIFSGNLEVVIVSPLGEVLAQFTEENNAYTLVDCIDGIYFVIIGGESAKFDISIQRSFD